MNSKKEQTSILIAGGVLGVLGSLLVKLGNPKNMGFCIACFIRDTAGALGLHRAGAVQYIRPEVIGLVLGSFLAAYLSREFKPRGGSSPFTRFILGFAVMVGALMFLGCPLRMVLRMAGGDLNAFVGLAGFFAGILIGVYFLNKGYDLKRAYTMTAFEGFAFSGVQLALLALLAAAPAFIFFSEAGAGPGAMHAPLAAALAAGLIAGAAAQKTRLCMVGGLRDMVMFKDYKLLSGFAAVFAACLLCNFAIGSVAFSFEGQPVAHTASLWNFLGMVLVGLGSVLLGGCPMRQLILAGEGNTDSVVTVLGYTVGAAFCHNFGLASSAAGPTANGQIATILGIAVCLLIGFMNVEKE